jgi:eukaryotic-like serine/threonine-protein kinase
VAGLADRLQSAVGDRYRIERELGRGGMATVYLAQDLSLHRQVALKVLHPEIAAVLGPTRFEREIQTAARLQHPHILPLFESGGAQGQLWYSMPYVEGASLRQRLQRERQLPIEDSVTIATQVLSALDYAHRHGIIHRDVKPENILLQDDQAVLADLGIARAIDVAGEERLTETGLAVGTPAYMSPEQAAGERNLDPRSDVYSMGAVLYEMLAGEAPFSGPTAQAVIARRLTENPRPLRSIRNEIPPQLERTVLKALARSPADRHRTPGDLARELMAGTVVSPAHSEVRRAPHSRWLVPVVIAGLALLGAWFLLRPRSNPKSALDESLVAVAPFDVLDPKLQLWREGLVDLLSRNLDGAGPLRTVSPVVVVRRWSGRGDQKSAADLGRRTGAGLTLYGSLVSAGGDSVRLSASLLDVRQGRLVDEWEVRDLADRMDRLSDTLTMRVLQGLGRERAIGSVRLVGYGSSSLPAVKAFLQGEQLLRRSEWDSALSFYERAIELDSNFAPALRRASTALGWLRTGHDSLTNAYAFRAGIHNHGLPLRDSLLIGADSIFASLLDAGTLGVRADSLWGPRLHSFFTMIQRLTARYPEDPEVWILQGEADNHLGPFEDRTRQDQIESFDRAIALDSAFAPAYIHPIEISAQFGRGAVAKYLTPFLRLVHGDKNAEGALLLKALLDSTMGEADRLRLYENVKGDGLFSAYLVLSSLPDTGEAAISVSRYITTHLMDKPPFDNLTNARRGYAKCLMSRGHLHAGLRDVPDPDPGPGDLFSEAAILGAIPAAEVDQNYRKRLQEQVVLPLVMAFPWWAGRGDTASLHRAATHADSLARWSANAVTRSQARYASLSAAAHLRLAVRDTARALTLFTALPRDLCPACFLDRLTLAQLLMDRRQDQDAMRILRVDHPTWTLTPSPTAVLWTLLRGRAAERLNQKELAVQSYAWVAGMWRKPDPELAPYVSEAREGLARLTAERN